MPFDKRFAHSKKDAPPDARDRFAALAPMVVREPISTHIVASRSPSGKRRYLVVDRAVAPQDGDIVLMSMRNGFNVGRYRAGIPIESVWGTVVWYLQQG
ncbi:MAG: hypothetical protein LBQ36_04585 [Synergistaceae bacterium]|nr:hypothetical protein [Synergistaceae bacterium]